MRKRSKSNINIISIDTKIIKLKKNSKLSETDMNYDLAFCFNAPKKVRSLSMDLINHKYFFEDENFLIVDRLTSNKIIKFKDEDLEKIINESEQTNILNSNDFNPIICDIDEEIRLKPKMSEPKEIECIIESKFESEICERKVVGCLPKSSDTIRKLYYSKLIHKKLWNPSRTKKKHHTLIIFDWDDTLLPTTFLTPGGEYNDKLILSPGETEQFKLMEKTVYKVLTTALEKGETYIITNAAPGWVEYTANKFYPSILRVLQNIKVLSARGGYEKLYPKDYRQWKIQTFLEMKKEFDSGLITNIMCMGDSMIEMEAGHLLSSKFNKAYIKTIKFREAPKLKVLYKQLLMILEKFNEIYLTLKSLAISIDKKSMKRSS